MERTEIIVHSIISDPNDLKHSEYIGSGRDGFGNLVHIYDVDNDQLLHYGVSGMKWGKRNAYRKSINTAVNSSNKADRISTKSNKQSVKSQKALEKGHTAKSAKHSKKADKLSQKASKYNKLANISLSKASKMGYSNDSPKRDNVKAALREIKNIAIASAVATHKSRTPVVDSVVGTLYGNVYNQATRSKHTNRQKQLNDAAKKANALRDKNEG